MKIEVSRLPTEAMWGEGDARINLASIPLAMRPAIEDLSRAKLIKEKDSFGCALAIFSVNPVRSTWMDCWDEPYSFMWFVSGWGPERDRYIANAVRKLRPGLRMGLDTLELRTKGSSFEDEVESSEADGSFEWGDFPWGGMTFVQVGHLMIPVSVSCLAEVEDDAIAKSIGGLVGATMLKTIYPQKFGPNS